MVARVAAETARVFTVKVAVKEPWTTVTVFGTDAEALLLERGIVIPPAGAGEVSVTVQTEVPPPFTEAGLSTSDLIEGASRINCAVCENPLSWALMETD